jgi:hypothetical protein
MNRSSVCFVRSRHQVMKGHVIDSQKWLILTSGRLETRDQSEIQTAVRYVLSRSVTVIQMSNKSNHQIQNPELFVMPAPNMRQYLISYV